MADGQDAGQESLDTSSSIDPGILSLAQGLAQAQALAHKENPFAGLGQAKIAPEYAKETQKEQLGRMLTQTLTNSIGGGLSDVQDVQNNAAITNGLVNSLHGQDTGLPDLWSSPIEAAGKLFQSQQAGALGYARAKAGLDIEKAKQEGVNKAIADKPWMAGQIRSALGQQGSQSLGGNDSANPDAPSSPIGAKIYDPEKLAEKQFSTTDKINNSTEAKDFREASSRYQSMLSLYSQNNQPSAIAMIKNVAKVLDPKAIVRPGTFEIEADPGSPAMRLQGFLSEIESQGQLSPQHKAQLIGASLPNLIGSYQGYKNMGTQAIKGFAGVGGNPQAISMDSLPDLNGDANLMFKQIMGEVKDPNQAALVAKQMFPGFKFLMNQKTGEIQVQGGEQ